MIVMELDALIACVRILRARGMTPKAIAKDLGITRAEADSMIRRIARESAAETALVGCWVNAGWSQGLSWSDRPDWHDDSDDHHLGLVSVLVVREHRYEKVSVCVYLVDAQCLGVKNALGPRVLERTELDAFIAQVYAAYPQPPLQASLELARELVFGAEAYARKLGFEPHRDLAACRGHLGTWREPSPIVFGYHGKPFFMQGPDDDPIAVLEVLERSVGWERFDFVAADHEIPSK
jgi:hypothetical protein